MRMVPADEFIHEKLRAHVLSDGFPCVAAKSAFRNGTYRFEAYASMSGARSRRALAGDLDAFVHEMPAMGDFATFVACFDLPRAVSERRFEKRMWSLLQALADEDTSEWDPLASPNADDPSFAFSFRRTAFFVVGMHAASSRLARRFAFPTLVFNAHHQFDALRWDGRYDRIRDIVRRRDIALQGTPNPTLDDFGVRSEARQYASSSIERRCPFHPKRAA